MEYNALDKIISEIHFLRLMANINYVYNYISRADYRQLPPANSILPLQQNSF